MLQHAPSRRAAGRAEAEQVFREFAWSLASTLKSKRPRTVRKPRTPKGRH